MTAILKVDEIQDTSGNNIINENANTVTIGKAGDTVNVVGTLQSNGSDVPTVAGGITEADQWRVTTNITLPSGTPSDITSNWERIDTDGFAKIGTGMTESSGVFTFPSTGVYIISAWTCYQGATASYINSRILTSTDNFSTTNLASENYTFSSSASDYTTEFLNFVFNVTNTSTHKVKFAHRAQASGVNLQGGTNDSYNAFTFIRLGDSQ